MEPVGTTRFSFVQRLGNLTDQESWAQFHHRYGELLYRYARQRGADHAEAEDVVQEVELCVFKAMNSFRYDPQKGRFRSYLRTAVVNALGRRAKKKGRREASMDPLALDELSTRDAPMDAVWEQEWQAHQLRWALRSVAGDFAPATIEAFQLHVLDGCPVEETAAKLGLSKFSVYQAKSRVLRRLRDRIQSVGLDDELPEASTA
ncbi:MAG: sigma-70 family RNA polymerase sigma factor [Phycisphaerales bacterium]|nr:sigma-70 family RNA polymerase sigma factor [Phycisphaerales bacterium]